MSLFRPVLVTMCHKTALTTEHIYLYVILSLSVSHITLSDEVTLFFDRELFLNSLSGQRLTNAVTQSLSPPCTESWSAILSSAWSGIVWSVAIELFSSITHTPNLDLHHTLYILTTQWFYDNVTNVYNFNARAVFLLPSSLRFKTLALES